MSIAAINEQLLRAVGVGLALFDEKNLQPQFRNDVFDEWFGDDAPDLAELFPGLDIAAMRAAIAETGRYTHEISFRKKRRTLIIAQIITLAEVGDETVFVVECQNITRIRELEAMIESYSNMVERHTRDLRHEKEQVEKLLLNIMPKAAYDEYRNFGVVEPKRYEEASVLILDFTNFAENLESLSPLVFVSELNELYAAFDQIGEQFNCERIKTTGDTYLCIAGLHDAPLNHAEIAVGAAVRFLRYLERRNENAQTQWRCRIGVASGPVIGSVVGVRKYVYDVFGPAVAAAVAARNHAADMEALIAPSARASLPREVELATPARLEAANAGMSALAGL